MRVLLSPWHGQYAGASVASTAPICVCVSCVLSSLRWKSVKRIAYMLLSIACQRRLCRHAGSYSS